MCRQLGDRAHGVSRATGHDIRLLHHRQQIVDEFHHYDVFVNNAYSNDSSQCDLFNSILMTWGDDPTKTIINIGSAVTEYTLTKEYRHLTTYKMHKWELMTLSTLAQERAASVQYVTFGYVGTANILAKYPDMTEYIQPEVAAEFIIKTPLIGMPFNRIEPSEPFSQTRSSDFRIS